MLDCFQVEICDSLENPLQKSNPPPSSCTVFTNTDSGRLRSSTLSKSGGGGLSVGISSLSTQRALMCHRFSTKITLLDVVGFGKQDNFNV